MKFTTKKQITIALVFLGAVVVSVWSLSPVAVPFARWLGLGHPDTPEFWTYPRYVKNPNTDLWAIQTGYGHAAKSDFSWPPDRKQILYFGLIRDTIPLFQRADSINQWYNEYSSDRAPIGYEYQYLDSAGAASFYAAFRKQKDSINHIGMDSAWSQLRRQQRKDSLFNLQHTYQ